MTINPIDNRGPTRVESARSVVGVDMIRDRFGRLRFVPRPANLDAETRKDRYFIKARRRPLVDRLAIPVGIACGIVVGAVLAAGLYHLIGALSRAVWP